MGAGPAGGLTARTALVTGASRGIGRAVAIALAGAGYDVAITARTVVEGSGPQGLPGSLQTTAAAIRGQGRRAVPVTLDLLDTAALAPAVADVVGQFGHLDVLVNNAIYVGPQNDRTFLDTDPLELSRRIHGDLTAQVLLTQPAVRAMAERGSGTVITMTSGAAFSHPPRPVGDGGWALGYGCAKGGLHRMAGILARELPGLSFYNLQPGYVATERARADPGLGWLAARGKSPEEIGRVVCWMLAQPPGVLRNGSTIVADEVPGGPGQG